MPPKPKADELLEQMWQEYVDSFDMDNLPEHEFSPKFEKKMEKLIRKQRRLENRPPALRMVRKVAVILVICCAVAFSGLMTVEAFRDRVIHFFTQVFSTYTEIEISTEGYEDTELIPLELGYLPEGMELVENIQDKGYLRKNYIDDAGNFIKIYQRKISDNNEQNLILDTEGVSIKAVTYNHTEIKVIEKDNTSKLIWTQDNSLNTIYSNLTWEELDRILNSIFYPQ